MIKEKMPSPHPPSKCPPPQSGQKNCKAWFCPPQSDHFLSAQMRRRQNDPSQSVPHSRVAVLGSRSEEEGGVRVLDISATVFGTFLGGLKNDPLGGRGSRRGTARCIPQRGGVGPLANSTSSLQSMCGACKATEMANTRGGTFYLADTFKNNVYTRKVFWGNSF